MIHIIRGDINSGKSKKIKELYLKNGGDGIVSEKIFIDEKFYGYKVTRLSTGESLDFIYENKYAPSNWKNIFKNNRFTFNLDVIIEVEKWIDEILDNKNSPIYIDEIGRWELNGGGFYKILKKLRYHDVYMTLRSPFINEFMKKFYSE